MSDVLVPPGPVGSTDWAGGAAPAAGSHTGTSTVVMLDGATFRVAHSVAESTAKVAAYGSAPSRSASAWVAFDQPGAAVPVVLNVSNVQTVTP